MRAGLTVERRVPTAELIENSDEVEHLDRLHASIAREDFWRFRLFMHRHLLEGWWIKETAYELQDFYEAFVRGERPKMVFESPPQHGKSMTAVDFVAWVAGKNPDLSAIYASYADDLGMKANAALQRLIMSDRYRLTFPNTGLVETGLAAQFGLSSLRYARTSSFLEYVGQRGSFRNVTVNGGVTGQSLDLGVIDDPIKGRAEANSVTIRNKTWDWLTDDFFTRFSEQAALLIIMTRWHVDDPMSRFLEKFPDARIIRYPAIATHDEPNRKKGAPLFPELKSLSFINERRKMMTRASFEALYQQSPIVVGGNMFPIEQFKPIQRLNKSLIKRSIRYIDKAGTEDGGAYTAGVLMHEMKDDVAPSFVIEDVIRGQWSALTREKRIRQAAEFDQARYGYGKVTYFVEQEPGSGGKESAERTVRDTLRGFAAYPDKVTGDKITRAEPYAAQVEAGNVGIVVADWNKPVLDEHEAFPNGTTTKDTVDAAAGAFAKLAGSLYDSSLAWVGGPGM